MQKNGVIESSHFKKYLNIMDFLIDFEDEYYEKEFYKKYKNAYHIVLKIIIDIYEKKIIKKSDNIFIENDFSKIYIIDKSSKSRALIHLKFIDIKNEKKNFCLQIYGTEEYEDEKNISNIILKELIVTGGLNSTSMKETLLKNNNYQKISYTKAEKILEKEIN